MAPPLGIKTNSSLWVRSPSPLSHPSQEFPASITEDNAVQAPLSLFLSSQNAQTAKDSFYNSVRSLANREWCTFRNAGQVTIRVALPTQSGPRSHFLPCLAIVLKINCSNEHINCRVEMNDAARKWTRIRTLNTNRRLHQHTGLPFHVARYEDRPSALQPKTASSITSTS